MPPGITRINKRNTGWMHARWDAQFGVVARWDAQFHCSFIWLIMQLKALTPSSMRIVPLLAGSGSGRAGTGSAAAGEVGNSCNNRNKDRDKQFKVRCTISLFCIYFNNNDEGILTPSFIVPLLVFICLLWCDQGWLLCDVVELINWEVAKSCWMHLSYVGCSLLGEPACFLFEGPCSH